MSDLTPEQIAEFLQRPLVAVFVTLRANGSPHAIPIWYEFVDGAFLVFTSSRFQRVKNLERDVRAAITISTHDEPYMLRVGGRTGRHHDGRRGRDGAVDSAALHR